MNITLYTFPPHLTHVLQPLDVGVFQPYKHWHRKAVQHAVQALDIDFNMASFFRDLTEIRVNTFKKGTIKGAFCKSGMWPINCQRALEKMKVYSVAEPENPLESAPPGTPRKPDQVIQQLHHWRDKGVDHFSSPSRGPFESFIRGAEAVLEGAYLKDLAYIQLATKVANQRKRKFESRAVIQANAGPLTVENAMKRKEEKAQKEKEAKRKTMDRIAQIALNKARNELYTRGVAACKAEFARRKQVRALQKANKPVLPELLEPIPDPEKEAKEEDIQEEANMSLVAYQQGDELWEEEDDVDINTGFIRFDKDQREFDGREFIDPGLFGGNWE
jgi:hypothetical protein